MWLIETKVIERYFNLILFITLYKVVLTFEFVNETLVCDHSKEGYWAALILFIMLYKVVPVNEP